MSRKLGQHFLKNKSAVEKIIAALELKNGDTIIEIGPGRGALTIPLSKKCEEVGCKVIAIEKDPQLATSGKIQEAGNVKIIKGDALKVIPKLASGFLHLASWKLVGNIPYYITGKLLRIIGELDNRPELIVLTIQKEVAERIVVKPPRMNLLAASVQIWANAEIISNLKPSDFNPPPKVSSSIIKLTPKPVKGGLKEYYSTIKIVFKQPRKTLLNNLSTAPGMTKIKALEILKKAGLTGSERPQNLELKTLIKLSTLIRQ